MIEKISSLLQNISKSANTKEINNTLPILLHILKKEGKDTYFIKMGNLQTKTKSQKELIIGAKYLANVNKSSVGSILLSNLTPYPKILDDIKEAPLKLKHEELKNFLSKDAKDFTQEWKNFLLDHFVQASNKNDFLFFGNMLLSLQKEILTLIVSEENKDSLLQIKKNKTLSQLEFYALYPHLGDINGIVSLDADKNLTLKLEVKFESIKNLLEKNLSSLDLFSQVHIIKSENISPLFSFEDHLLNLKG